MRFSSTLSIYITKNLLLNLLYVFLCFCFISFILDLLELIRKLQGREIMIAQMFKIAFYKVPFLVFSFFPFIFLFGFVLTITKMNNYYEIVAAKAAGVSIWSLCIPFVVTVFILSLLILGVFQPVSAIFLDKNRILENQYFGYKSNRISLSINGIWLHDQTDNPFYDKIINARTTSSNGEILSDVRVYCAGENGGYTTSYFAKSLYLKEKYFILNDIDEYRPGEEVVHYNQLTLPTSLVASQIQESIANPEIISFWNLKAFIEQIKQSGFSALKHELYYKSLLASPLLYISLVLISLSCSVSMPRKGKYGKVFVLASAVSIVIFFIEKIVNVLALTAVLPMGVAVFAPPLAYFLLSAAVLIHYEEE